MGAGCLCQDRSRTYVIGEGEGTQHQCYGDPRGGRPNFRRTEDGNFYGLVEQRSYMWSLLTSDLVYSYHDGEFRFKDDTDTEATACGPGTLCGFEGIKKTDEEASTNLKDRIEAFFKKMTVFHEAVMTPYPPVG